MSTFTVTNTNNSGAGSLRQAVLNANSQTGKDIINFGGLFTDGLAHTINLSGSGLSITDDLTIEGTNPSKLTIKDDTTDRVFDIHSGVTSAINGLTITNTYNGANGGGAISNVGILTLTDSIIKGNTVNYDNRTNLFEYYVEGSGIYNTGSLTVNYCIISNNVTSNEDIFGVYGLGGGIYNSGSLTVNYSTISDNTATNGGGIVNYGTLSVNHSTITGNTAGVGGGIENNGTVSVSYSTISDNTARIGGGIANGVGGGIVNDSGTLSVSHSTISGNTAGIGGGIYNYGNKYSEIILTVVSNSTINNNHASTGGGIYNYGTLSATNTTISNNYARDEGGGIYNSSSNGNGRNNQLGIVTVSYSSITGNTAGTAGGGIYNNADDGGYYTNSVRYDQLGIVTITNSTISDNQAHFGGGIYNIATLTVGNSIIRHNKAFGIELSSGAEESGQGGGIYNANLSYATATIDYSTVACNFDTPEEDSNKFIKLDNIAGEFITKGSVVRV